MVRTQSRKYPGLRYLKNRERWSIHRTLSGKSVYFGQFHTYDNAVEAYEKLESEGAFQASKRLLKNRIIYEAGEVLCIDVSTKTYPAKTMLIHREDWDRLQLLGIGRAHVGRYSSKLYVQAKLNGEVVLLHRLIVEPARGAVDHINNDGLDLTRGNLRAASQMENTWNKRCISNKTGYKGVFRHGKKWAARLCSSGKRYNLGSYETPEMAAAAYDAKALELRGKFHATNADTVVATEVAVSGLKEEREYLE